MPDYILDWINKYGYVILFLLVLLQEIGVPSFPNEMFLFYFGYLASLNHFSISVVLLISIIADILGAVFLYFIFFYFGISLKKYLPNIVKKKLSNLKKIINSSTLDNPVYVFLIRITPFIRGYVSVFAGISHYSFKAYFKQIILSAILWTGGWVLFGFFTSNLIDQNFQNNSIKTLLLLLISVVIIMFLIYKLMMKLIIITRKK